MSPLSPELALVDRALVDSEQIATRLDAWLARTEWRAPSPAPAMSNARRTALISALLVSMLANGLLASFLLLRQNSGPTLQPAQHATFIDDAAQGMIQMPQPTPAQLSPSTAK